MARTARRRRSRLDGFTLTMLALGAYTTLDYLRDHPTTTITLGVLCAAALTAWCTRQRWRRAWPSRGKRIPLRMTPDEFEQHVADLLREAGHREVKVSGGAGDLGADVTSRDPYGRRVVVQCKRYGPGNPVGSPDLQRFVGTARPHHKADVALFVTSSRFTRPALDYALQHGVFTIDGPALEQWRRTGSYPWG